MQTYAAEGKCLAASLPVIAAKDYGCCLKIGIDKGMVNIDLRSKLLGERQAISERPAHKRG